MIISNKATIAEFDLAEHGHVSARLTKLFGTWARLGAAGTLPRRSDFSPHMVPDLLPYMFMDDVLYDPLRFRFRLVGTEIAISVGHDPTGKYRDEIQNAPTAIQRLERVCETRAPIIGLNLTYDLDERFFSNYSCLHLPFASTGPNVDMIMSISNMTRREARWEV